MTNLAASSWCRSHREDEEGPCCCSGGSVKTVRKLSPTAPSSIKDGGLFQTKCPRMEGKSESGREDKR